MRVLVIAPNWIGDAVMSLSLLDALHADQSLYFSNGKPCEIEVLASTITAPVYQFSPLVHAVHAEPFAHGALQWGLRCRVGKALRAKQFDLAFVLPNSLKSALVPWFANIPVRIGYGGELRALVLSKALRKPSKQNKPSMLQWYGALGGYDQTALRNPTLQVGAKAEEQVCAHFHVQLGFLAVSPGAEYGLAKRWPVGHFAAAVCSAIADGVPLALRGRVVVLAGKTSLSQAVVLLSAAGQLLTNDSGLMHVAAALGVRVQAVFGSSSPHHTPPLSPSATVHYLALACSPCFQRTCPLGHMDCLVKLQPKTVIDALDLNSEAV
jgi:heptosyltransferase II